MVETVDEVIERLRYIADDWTGIDGTKNGQMVAVPRKYLKKIADELDQAIKLERCKSKAVDA